jgi:signal transduction histidine kinase
MSSEPPLLRDAAAAAAPPPPEPAAIGAESAVDQGLARGVRAKLWLLIAAVLASAVMAVLSLYTFGRQTDAIDEVPQAIEVRRRVRVMVIEAVSAEAAQRGYLLTGDRRYLEDFYTWDPQRGLEELRAYAGEEQQRAVALLAEELVSKQAEMTTTIRLYEEGAKDAAWRLVSSNLGKKFMDDARVVMDAIIAREDARIRSLLGEVSTIRRIAMPLVVGGTGLTVLGLLIGLITISRSTRALERMAKRDAEQARRLEEQSLLLSTGLVAAGEANRALIRSNRDLDQFAYVASHDLKAPLRAISSLSTWIEEDLGDGADDKTREHLRLMRSRVNRMSALIEGILGYSRAGRDSELTFVDSLAQLKELRDAMPPPDGVTLTVLEGPWPSGMTQRVQLAQVWSNLLGNAFKHGVPKGGSVQLGCARCPPRSPGDSGGGPRPSGGQQWQFWVRDDGPGIEKAYHQKIFDLFQRLSSRDQVEGAGIGLSIVRKLVDTNGGKVWIESEPGAGTTFTFTWSFRDV